MRYKVYRDNKYSNRRIKTVKKFIKRFAAATGIGVIVICAANLIPINAVKADAEVTNNEIQVEMINTEDGIDFKNVDYEEPNNGIATGDKDEDMDEGLDPFNVGSSLDKNMVVDYLSSYEGGLVSKYASDYGVDPNIMVSIAMQETTLNHSACIPGGDMYSGYGVGLMQLESPSGEEVTAYNYNTKGWETEYITMDNACDIEKNIKIGCMLFQNKLKENNGNILLSIQSHNYGQPMIDMMMNNLYGTDADNVKREYDNISWLSEVKNISDDPGKYLDDWVGGYGDGNYLENVLKFCPEKEVKYKYGPYEYTFNLKTMKVTDMFEFSTSIKK